MTSKFHKRRNYEQLYQRLVKESGLPLLPHERLTNKMSDYQLLRAINYQLKHMDCLLFSADELEMELH